LFTGESGRKPVTVPIQTHEQDRENIGGSHRNLIKTLQKCTKRLKSNQKEYITRDE
jgi:hypothetical protein